MKLNVEDIRNGLEDGRIVYICDYRREDITKKPIRNVEPTRVMIRPNSEVERRIYYSSSHFRPVNKKDEPLAKIIPLFDNTGFRLYTGVPLSVFDNLEECEEHWNRCLDEVIGKFEAKKKTVLADLDKEIEALGQKCR